MEQDKSSLSGNFTDIRFNAFYFVCLFIIAIIMLIGFFLTLQEKDWLTILFLILALIAFIHQQEINIYGLINRAKELLNMAFAGLQCGSIHMTIWFSKTKSFTWNMEGRPNL